MMGFVNEYVSEEDIQAHKLDDLWNYYKGRHIMPESRLESGLKFNWTIDRETGSWLYSFGFISSLEGSISGRPEPINEYVFFLCVEGNLLEFRLSIADKSSKRFDEIPFVIVWQSISCKLVHQGKAVDQSIIMDTLKKALTTYGHRGISYQVPNTEVKFEF